MPALPWPLPLTGYAGLGNGLSELSSIALNYVRQPVTMELTDDGVTAANLGTLEWGTAGNDWGPISSVLVYDSPTGGSLLFEAALSGSATPYNWGYYSAGAYSPTTAAPLWVHMYDRPRISASSLTVAALAGSPAGFGTGGFGRYGYATSPVVEGAGAVILTFAVTYPCSPGTWSPGPYARAA